MWNLWRTVFVAFALTAFVPFSVADDARIQKVLDGQATLSLPIGFARVDSEKLNTEKHQAELFADEHAIATVTVAKRSYPGTSSLETLVAVMAYKFEKKYSGLKWHDKGLRDIGERQFGYLEFTDKSPTREDYTYMYFTKAGGDLVTFMIVCKANKLDERKSELLRIIESTRVE